MSGTLISDPLSAFLSAAGRRRWCWGELDCFLFVADWVELCTGRDPAGPFRGAYESERQARTILRLAGGPLALATERLGAIGLSPMDAPQRGDVGLVRVGMCFGRRVALVPAGAVCVASDKWAVKTTGQSMTIGSFPVLAAWSLSRG